MLKLQVDDFDKSSWEFELNDFIFDFKMKRFEYVRNNCANCIKNGMQEKRNCSLLRGFKDFVCDSMSKSIKIKLQEKEDKLINGMVKL